ncbi:unnamed protein product [Schistosoma curassoni]|uniref:Uncharacterized protein n=1 Tax=Schistosoma curassoni TaxID=6186 RepID=A0A183KLY4_9TREM|nr:unnamed protein product [Schistosoma curassoni]
MERPDNVGDQEDQSNINGNEEIKLGSETYWNQAGFKALRDLLKEEETTMEDNWKSIKEASTPTCQELLGLKKHYHKEWISIETGQDQRKEKQEESN